jgi:hypothetical protein
MSVSGLRADLARARKVAQELCDAFYNSQGGIHGETVATSRERNRPRNVKVGTRDHLLFIALTSSVDRQRNAYDLWDRAQKARQSDRDCYLFDPDRVVQTGFSKVSEDLKRLGISQKHGPDASAWFSICETFASKWHGDPNNFLNSCKYHAPSILDRLKNDHHWSKSRGRDVRDYPQLRGAKIGPMFLRLLRDWTPVKLVAMDEIRIPIDIQVLRATFCTGALSGSYDGPAEPLFADVRSIWHRATQGLTSKATGQPMIGLDMDGPLWRVGRYWCGNRAQVGCPYAPRCRISVRIDNDDGRYRINAGGC